MTRWDLLIKALVALIDKLMGYLAVFFAGFSVGQRRAQEAQRQAALLELELAHEKNKAEVKKILDELSASQSIDRAIESVRKDSDPE